MTHLFFVFLLLYYIFGRLFSKGKRSRRLFAETLGAFTDLSAQQGGQIVQNQHRFVQYESFDQRVRVEVSRHGRPRLTIRIRESFPFSATFYRLPRLVYAFLEEFLAAGLKLDRAPYFVLTSQATQVSELKDKPGYLPLMVQLGAAGFSVRFSRDGVSFWKTVSAQDTNQLALVSSIRLGLDLARICSQETLKIPVQPVISEQRCAYCKESIEEMDATISCAVCHTPHHQDCFQLNGKCAVFGCNSTRSVEPLIPIAS